MAKLDLQHTVYACQYICIGHWQIDAHFLASRAYLQAGKSVIILTYMSKFDSKIISLLGMPDAEARVYLTALELGETSIQGLARKSGVSRSTIYTFIEGLKSGEYS